MIKHLIWIAVLLIGGVACSPVYTTRDVYHPPTHDKGLACIKGCGGEERLCQSDCAGQRQACEYDARDRAKMEYNEAVDEYSLETERYAIELRDYHERKRDHDREERSLERERELMKQRCAAKNEQACAHANSLKKEIKRLRAPSEPGEPKRPQLAELERAAVAECDFSCGCRDAFNLCYVACGGQVTQERECIEHCD